MSTRGAPLERRARDICPRCLPFNPALYVTFYQINKLSVNIWFFHYSWNGFAGLIINIELQKGHWQPWIFHLLTGLWVVCLESPFTNLGNDLCTYLSLIVTKCCGEKRSFSKLKIVEWTKEHHQQKQAEQPDSKEYRAWTSMWDRHNQYHKQIRYWKMYKIQS